MSTKLLNVELSMEEYIPVKPLLDKIFAGDWKAEYNAIHYITAVASMHGTNIPLDKLDVMSIVYIKVELRRRRNCQLSTTVMVTLAIPEETE